MQTNLYISAANDDPSMFKIWHKNMYRGPSKSDGYMMPLFYLDERGQISSSDAALFKSQVRIPAKIHILHSSSHCVMQVYGTQTVGLIIGITHVCIGGIALILGVAMCVTHSRALFICFVTLCACTGSTARAAATASLSKI
jgi:hypothetical protein